MTFHSPVFFVFLAAFLPVYFAIRSWAGKKGWLLVGGLVFYGWFNPAYLGLVFLSTTIDYACVNLMSAPAADPRRRRLAVTASVISNLTILGTFKYVDFFIGNVVTALDAMGLAVAQPALNLLLPIGISFYSFEAISYAVDVYQRKTRPARSYLDLLLFITFFPHLVAGPIVRARDFLPQLETERRPTLADVMTAIEWIVVGYFLKVGVADNLSSSVDRVYATPAETSTTEAWLATIYFAFQIFGDFAGYTLIARGLAKVMGFDLAANFHDPYLARGFSDFWRRWHVSLSSWLRDYLYVPLGGSRGSRWFTYRNLMLTMLLGGLWHGAAWTFVVWGALHGTYLVVEHALRRDRPSPPISSWIRDVSGISITFLFVVIAWVFFRASSLADAGLILRAMFWVPEWRLATPAKSMLKDGIWVVPMVLYLVHAYLRERGIVLARFPILRGIVLGLLAFTTLVLGEVSDAFIYFQF